MFSVEGTQKQSCQEATQAKQCNASATTLLLEPGKQPSCDPRLFLSTPAPLALP